MNIIMVIAVALGAAVLTAGPADAGPLAVAVGAAVSALGGILGGSTLLGFALKLALSVALSFGMQLLSGNKKPKAGNQPLERPGTNISQKESVSPRRLVYGRTRLGGTIVFLSSHQSNSWLYFAIALCEGEIDAIEGPYLNDQLATRNPSTGALTSTIYAARCYTFYQTGTGSDSPPAFFTGRTDGLWTTAHQMLGVAALYVAFEWDSDGTYKDGLPNVSALVRGLKIYDPRSATTAYSNNAALVIRDYLLRPKEKGGFGLSPGEIDETNFIAQANICDESVTTNDGTVPRYTINGIIELDEGTSPGDVLDEMLAACQGRLAWTSGKMRLFVGAWRASTFTITADMVIDAPQITTRQSMAGQFNAVKGTYRSAAVRWETTDFKAITSSVFEAEDGGDRIFRDLTYNFVTDNATVQRLAKMELYRAREPMEVQLQCNLRAYEVAVGDVVSVTLDRYGWAAKTFEVTGWKWSVKETEGGEALAIDLTLRESSSAAYSWSISDEQLLAAAPATNLPNWNEPGPPTALSVSEELYQTTGSAGVKTRAIVTWSAPDDAFVDTFEAQYKLASASGWTSLPTTSALFVQVDDVQPLPHNFRVRSVNVIRAKSAWSQIDYTVLGLLAPPASPTNLRAVAAGAVITLFWDRSASLDVVQGGQVVVRFQSSGTPSWDTASPIGNPLPGDTTTVTLPCRTGNYLVRFRDSAGNYSPGWGTVSAEYTSLIVLSTLATAQEDTGFTGTKTNMTASGGVLSLGSGQTDGTYVFANGIDLVTVKTVRLTAQLVGAAISTSDTIDSRAALIDTWEDFDGAVTTSEVRGWVEFRKTNDDPSGSPSWSAWEVLEAAEVRARAFQFRCRVTANDTAYTYQITQLRAIAEGP